MEYHFSLHWELRYFRFPEVWSYSYLPRSKYDHWNLIPRKCALDCSLWHIPHIHINYSWSRSNHSRLEVCSLKKPCIIYASDAILVSSLVYSKRRLWPLDLFHQLCPYIHFLLGMHGAQEIQPKMVPICPPFQGREVPPPPPLPL